MFNITSRLNFTRTLGSTVMLGIMLFLSLPAATYAVDIITDNRDPGVSFSNVPGWSGQSITSAYRGSTVRTRNKSAWSTFKFGSLQSGKYDVYMHWPIKPPRSYETPDNAAPVIIKHSSGTQTVRVNQQQNGGKWNRLGSWTLNNTAYLTLTNRGNGIIYADAVKLVPSLVTPPQDPTLSLTANPVKVGAGGAATLSWASQHTTSCTASGGWSGSKGTSGSQTVKNITSSQTYNLTCAGTTKNVSATVKVAVISTPPPPPPVQPVVGLSVGDPSGTFDAAGQAFFKELGAHSIRVGYGHGDHDFKVNWAAQNGMGVLLFLGYGKECGTPTTASARQCYADRSASLARTYGNKVQYYEVWNEWNGGLGLGRYPGCLPTCADAVMYTDLLCRTYKAVKAVQPNATIVGGATAGTHTAFIGRMLDAGAGNCMDVVSVHPYVYHIGSSQFRVPLVDSPASVGVDKFVEAVTAVHNIVKQKTGKDMKILVTEEGKSDRRNSANEQLTADYITELYDRAPKIPFLEGIWWFCLKDPGSDPAAVGYGLVRSNNTKKRGFAAYQAAANK